MCACWKTGQTIGAIWSTLSLSRCAVRKKRSRSSRLNSELGFFLGMMRPAKPGQQSSQLGAVLFRQRYKLQTQPGAGFCMPDDSVCPDLPFLHQKMQPGHNAMSPCLGCFNEQASHAHVPYARDILLSTALPVHPHVVGRGYTGRQSSGWGID